MYYGIRGGYLLEHFVAFGGIRESRWSQNIEDTLTISTYLMFMFLTKTEIPIGICFFASGIMEIATLLMAGDLNCILGPDEV